VREQCSSRHSILCYPSIDCNHLIDVGEQLLGRDRATVADLDQFDAIIDVRTPSEFAFDHIPQACNLPVLSDAERARVGTLYKQVSPFDARKLGAALVASNIARHLEQDLQDRARTWRPLIYCWRGGQRSGAMTHVLRQIGWDARQLQGGYKTFRHRVLDDIPGLVSELRYCVVCGLTGSGKSRLLAALRRRGEQVLDLEGLALHRGSLLGDLPDLPQPSQKWFESQIWRELRRFDLDRTVYIESESKKIGTLQVPQALLDAMWRSECFELEADIGTRVQLLKAEYAHFLSDRATLNEKLAALLRMHGHGAIEHWKAMAATDAWDELVEDLLVRHYDPAYRRSIVSHYPRLSMARCARVSSAADEEFARVAAQLAHERMVQVD
jgi:tRNA 2-selenouridine synthase